MIERNNVSVGGAPDGRPMVFSHGFGCDQNMWRHVAPRFADRYRTVLYDHVGFGDSDISAYDPERYSTLGGYADDLLQICDELDLSDVVFVGHSVAAMIGMKAALAEPGQFAHLVMVCPSPRYIDDEDNGYVGGFSRSDIDGLLEALDQNYLGWSSSMAPVIMGNEDRPELGQELTNSFCRTDPNIASQFARVTFLGDSRSDLGQLAVPTLILQCDPDPIAPPAVGEFVRRAIPDSELVNLAASGHCPNLSAPDETYAAIEWYLDGFEEQ